MKTANMKTLLAILAFAALSGFNINASAQTNSPSSPAAAWLTRQVDDYSSRLYVYSDSGDLRNTFTQRGYMSGGNVAASALDESSTVAYSGITSIKVGVPIAPGAWSGWTFATGVLSAGSTVPQMDWGDHNAKYDLTGAQKLVLHARAADGETALVEFKMGTMGGAYPDSISPNGKSSGVVKLTEQWQTVEIDLSGANLSGIAAGFVFVLNDGNLPKNSVTFYIDDIYYDFGAARNMPLFLASYESVPLDKPDSNINSYSYSYDSAMTVLALAYAGKTRQAAQVADALLFALYNDRNFTPAQRGVRNGYASGSPVSPPGWRAGTTGKAPYARLVSTSDKDSYSDSYSTGNNAWTLLALLKIYHDTRDAKYLDAARDLAAYLHTLRDDASDSFGGFTGGWEGFDDAPQTKDTYASTEHNIDLYSAFSQLANTVGPADPVFAQYTDDAAHAKSFVLKMYNPGEGFFYTGTGPDNKTINKDVLPLDTNTWSLQSLVFLNEPNIDPAKIISYMENNLRDPATGFYKYSNKTTAGFWTEGTYQKIVTDLVMGRRESYQQQLAALATQAQPDGSIRATNVETLLTGFDGSVYYPRVSAGATAWKTLAELGVNPLDPGLYAAGHNDAFTPVAITLNAQGGSVFPATQTVTTNYLYGALPSPTRAGYTFAGWWTGPNGAGAQITSTTIVTAASQTLYALWTPNPQPPPGDPVLAVDKIILTLAQPATSTDTFGITSNIAWTAQIAPATATWLAVTPGEGAGNSINTAITISANTTGAPRTASIIVTGGDITRTLIATQAATDAPGLAPAPLPFGAMLALTLNGTPTRYTVTDGNTLTLADASGALPLAYEYSAAGDTCTLVIPDLDSVYWLRFTNTTTAGTLTGALTLYTFDDDATYEIDGAFTYTPPVVPAYSLTLINGATPGSGPYAAGTKITITANAAPSGQAFDKWTTTAGGAFANETAAATTFMMPANPTQVIATYKDRPAASNHGGGAPSLLYLAAAIALMGARASCPRKKLKTTNQ